MNVVGIKIVLEIFTDIKRIIKQRIRERSVQRRILQTGSHHAGDKVGILFSDFIICVSDCLCICKRLVMGAEEKLAYLKMENVVPAVITEGVPIIGLDQLRCGT